MLNTRSVKYLSIIGIVIITLLIPVFTKSEYLLHVSILIFVNIIACVSFRYIVITGEWSFAHAPLMGMGGYVSALLVMKLGFSFWVALPLSFVSTMLVSILIYYPCLRTTGTFFFFCSYAIAEIMRLCWVKFEDPFGGTTGLIGIPRPDSIAIPGLPVVEFTVMSKLPFYYLGLILALFSIVVLYMLENSRLGNIVSGIKESKLLSSYVGIRVWWYQMVVYAIASGFAGLAGAFFAHYMTILVPSDFYWGFGIDIVIFSAVGGTAQIIGPILGVIIFMGLKEVLSPFPHIVPLVWGIILAVTLVFLPGGLISLVNKKRPVVNLYKKVRGIN
jgi:branched-chain amino acid transport system permease protein